MKRKWLLSLFILIIAMIALGAVGVSAQTGYSLDWWTVDGGGGSSAAGVYILDGTIGQPDAGISSGGTYTLSGGFWSGAVLSHKIYYSNGPQDGWILESSETSGIGGTKNNRSTTLYLGDDAANKQFRSILSFNTSGIPTGANITKVTLMVKKSGVVGGGNPIKIFKGILVDIKKGNFGTATLALGDFKAAASKTYGPFNPALSGGWYSIDLTSGQTYINRTGNTQIRLRFKLDDNNNSIANYLKLYSGNAPVASRPQLIVEYYVP